MISESLFTYKNMELEKGQPVVVEAIKNQGFFSEDLC